MSSEVCNTPACGVAEPIWINGGHELFTLKAQAGKKQHVYSTPVTDTSRLHPQYLSFLLLFTPPCSVAQLSILRWSLSLLGQARPLPFLMLPVTCWHSYQSHAGSSCLAHAGCSYLPHAAAICHLLAPADCHMLTLPVTCCSNPSHAAAACHMLAAATCDMLQLPVPSCSYPVTRLAPAPSPHALSVTCANCPSPAAATLLSHAACRGSSCWPFPTAWRPCASATPPNPASCTADGPMRASRTTGRWSIPQMAACSSPAPVLPWQSMRAAT